MWRRGFANDPAASAELCLSHVYKLMLAFTTAQWVPLALLGHCLTNSMEYSEYMMGARIQFSSQEFLFPPFCSCRPKKYDIFPSSVDCCIKMNIFIYVKRFRSLIYSMVKNNVTI